MTRLRPLSGASNSRTERHRITSRSWRASSGWCRWTVLEIHPWGSRIEKLETPDRVTIDLDPDEGLPWERVTEAAIDVREALLGIGLK
ncbi:MAG TPA: hypothetical protein VLJ17_12250, partial [Xanthobacteraceae bacterium]|nr:hypothetical protein [Xanthobacteraceae bacterium]